MPFLFVSAQILDLSANKNLANIFKVSQNLRLIGWVSEKKRSVYSVLVEVEADLGNPSPPPKLQYWPVVPSIGSERGEYSL